MERARATARRVGSGGAGALALLATLLPPRLCLADNLGAIGGKGLGELILGALIGLGLTVVFIVLAVVLKRKAKPTASARGAAALVISTRVLAIAWYALTLAPVVYNLATVYGHDVGWVFLACIIAGLPAHISSIVALVRAQALRAAIAERAG